MRDQGIEEYFAEFEPPEGFKAELLRREIVLSGGEDIVHNHIVSDVADQIPRGGWHAFATQHISIDGELSKPRPDLVVFERGTGDRSGWLVPASDVALLLEVVSVRSADRDYGLKRSVYAAGSIPAYLIVDPYDARCVLLTEPYGAGEDAGYEVRRTVPFGTPLRLDLLGITLDTTEFGTLPAVKRHHRP
ncbi:MULTISPECIES: Uma2 family endonuclease [Streptomyces]|uniref:Uma2 family endonuclease n=1 Tax=Streptomyces siderophoricus TaxID=2802281 RepID=A0ABS1N139_9ACTN|nr:Uma2 family endonuclease [Streptomyces sp. 9-7]MBL1093641.1 Uma2 family endonuclease [Streptomyces sp. 9-7]